MRVFFHVFAFPRRLCVKGCRPRCLPHCNACPATLPVCATFIHRVRLLSAYRGNYEFGFSYEFSPPDHVRLGTFGVLSISSTPALLWPCRATPRKLQRMLTRWQISWPCESAQREVRSPQLPSSSSSSPTIPLLPSLRRCCFFKAFTALVAN